MHVNFKYVVVSIGSIFLALGIGILIGSNLGTSETMQKQNEAIVKDIDKQVSSIKARDEELIKENKKVKENAEEYRRYIESHKSELVSNKLNGKVVGIISFSKNGVGKNVAKEVKNAGGTVGFNIQINEDIFKDSTIAELNKNLSLNLKNSKDVIALLNDSIRNSNNSGVLTNLMNLGYVKMDSFISQFDSLSSIVIVNGQDIDKENSDVNLVKQVIEYMKDDKQVVLVQNQSVGYDKLKPFLNLKVATINNVDQTAGQISLINCLFNDKIIGNFGRIYDDNGKEIKDAPVSIAVAK